jgi:hypothetical protein
MTRQMTQTVELNGSTFPRYLTSPYPGAGWRITDMTTRQPIAGSFPNKAAALKAAKALNYA